MNIFMNGYLYLNKHVIMADCLYRRGVKEMFFVVSIVLSSRVLYVCKVVSFSDQASTLRCMFTNKF